MTSLSGNASLCLSVSQCHCSINYFSTSAPIRVKASFSMPLCSPRGALQDKRCLGNSALPLQQGGPRMNGTSFLENVHHRRPVGLPHCRDDRHTPGGWDQQPLLCLYEAVWPTIMWVCPSLFNASEPMRGVRRTGLISFWWRLTTHRIGRGAQFSQSCCVAGKLLLWAGYHRSGSTPQQTTSSLKVFWNWFILRLYFQPPRNTDVGFIFVLSFCK